MLRRLLAILLVAATPTVAIAASEQDRQACAKPTPDDPEARIESCTRLIDDTSVSGDLRAMAFRNRGIAYYRKGFYELSVADLDEALKINPRDISALGTRGRALGMMGQYDRSIATFTELLKINPRSVNAFNDRGIGHLRKGDLESALADFESALAITPKAFRARSNRGSVLARQGKIDQAIADFSEALKEEPNHILSYSNRGRAYEEKQEIAQAIADYEQVVARAGQASSNDEKRAVETARQRIARLSAALAEGKTRTPPERRVALVIGNAAYTHAGTLRNTINDAKALAASLRQLAFAEVRELYDADLIGLFRALKDFGDLATDADWALIYFAGHGIEVGGVNYLIPTDARLEAQAHIEDEALPLSRVLSKVAPASKLQLVILDACRNNPFVPRMRAARMTRSIGRGLASIEPEGAVMVAYAARDGTTALDGDAANGPYAEALLKYLAEPGLEISLLFRKVRDEVLAKTARQQEPYTYGSLPAQPFYFKR